MTKKKIETTEIAPGESATVGTRVVTNVSDRTVHVGVSDEQLAREAEEEAAADWALLHGVKTVEPGAKFDSYNSIHDIAEAVKQPGYEPLSDLDQQRWDGLSDLGKEEFARTGVMPSTAAAKQDSRLPCKWCGKVVDGSSHWLHEVAQHPECNTPEAQQAELDAYNAGVAARIAAKASRPAKGVEQLRTVVNELLDMQHARAAAGNGTSVPWQNAQAHLRKAIECIEQQAADDAEMSNRTV